MSRVVRSIVAVAAAAASWAVAVRPAGAQLMCNDSTMLPDPIVVTGSVQFEPLIRQLALKLSTQTAPRTIIYAIDTPTSCAGIASVASGADLAGTAGAFYTVNGAGYIRGGCTFAAGQKADLALSDLFYESCPNLPQPKPAALMDVLGPVVATVFVTPLANTTTQYLTYEEARVIYGCGVSAARPIAGFSDPTLLLCEPADAGPPAILAAGLGIPLSTLTPPHCAFGGGTALAVAQNVSAAGKYSLGFVTADGLSDDVRALVSPLPFRALGQTQAYLPDSALGAPDRKNVRDGHYALWGYAHLMTIASGGNPSRPAADFIGWVTGTKTNASFDYVGLESGLGLIPLCAMRVQRRSDGGLLSSYAPTETCNCAVDAALTRALPANCTQCTSNTMCSGGQLCRKGFCE